MRSEEGGNLQQFATLAALQPLAAALTNTEELRADAMPPADEDEEGEEEQTEAVWMQ